MAPRTPHILLFTIYILLFCAYCTFVLIYFWKSHQNNKTAKKSFYFFNSSSYSLHILPYFFYI